jgi:hypothetical protein
MRLVLMKGSRYGFQGLLVIDFAAPSVIFFLPTPLSLLHQNKLQRTTMASTCGLETEFDDTSRRELIRELKDILPADTISPTAWAGLLVRYFNLRDGLC